MDRIDPSRFRHLHNLDPLARRNANQPYLELEREAFQAGHHLAAPIALVCAQPRDISTRVSREP